MGSTVRVVITAPKKINGSPLNGMAMSKEVFEEDFKEPKLTFFFPLAIMAADENDSNRILSWYIIEEELSQGHIIELSYGEGCSDINLLYKVK